MAEQIKISSVNGNSQLLDGGSMFGNAPRALWQRWIQPDELSRILLACRAMLVQVGKANILCETGIGAFFDPKMAERFGVQNSEKHVLLESLESLGLKESDIDFVILSHLHFDHAGGLLPTYSEIQAGNDQLLFSKAKYIVGEEALERCKHPHFRDKASFIPGLYEKLEASRRMIVVPTGVTQINELPDCIDFIYSSGHTPGQMLARVTGSESVYIFTGDLIPGSHWVNLPITMGYDRFPEKIIDEKQALYESQDDSKTFYFFTHDMECSASKVKKNEKGKYEPVEKKPSLVFEGV